MVATLLLSRSKAKILWDHHLTWRMREGGIVEKTFELLLVEDNLGDVDLVKEALKEVPLAKRLHVARDGLEALAFLRREGSFAEVPHPNLILLDLNLPKKDGREVLAEIKQDEDLRRTPVVILTSSAAEADIVKCYDLHANSYVTKPVDYEDVSRVIRATMEFWLGSVTLPPR